MGLSHVKLMEHLSIVIPYRDQRKVYMGMIYKETRAQKMNLSEFPRVITIDSSQGNEAPIIIFDSVISQADTGRDMGFLTDSCRFNVACTHAADMLLIVGNVAVLDGRLNSDHKIKEIGEYKKKFCQNKPYLIACFEELNQRNAWVTDDVEPVTETPEILQLRKSEAKPDDDEVNDDVVEDDKINNDKVNDDEFEIKTDAFHDEAQVDVGKGDSQESVMEQNLASASGPGNDALDWHGASDSGSKGNWTLPEGWTHNQWLFLTI